MITKLKNNESQPITRGRTSADRAAEMVDRETVGEMTGRKRKRAEERLLKTEEGQSCPAATRSDGTEETAL